MLQRLKPEVLVKGSIGQQVAGKLLDGELIERHIAVEGLERPQSRYDQISRKLST